MPGFTLKRTIEAPVERVWKVLEDFGSISQWSPGVKFSELTSEGPVVEGTTRHCDFAPLGSVNERIEAMVPNRRLTVNLYETFKLPISNATADFNIAPNGDTTELTLRYSYTPNRMGKTMKRTTHKQMVKGIEGLADGLKEAGEHLVAAQ
jgi:uncharacterized protein YndB with AHSA1/START domain